jgi:4'-phosphopantetheinyl transferase EntD
MEIDFNLHPRNFEQHFTELFSGPDVLTNGEHMLVRKFSEKRQRDFSVGRYCAREALKKAGGPASEILAGAKNEPLWPLGYTGSISHSKTLAGAVVASSTRIRSLGLDIEKTGRVKAGMWDILFKPDEQDFLLSVSSAEQEFYTTLFFSMKESFYKLQYPITKTFLGFTDVQVLMTNNRFHMQLNPDIPIKTLLPELTEMFFTRHDAYLITLGWIEA